MWFLITMLLAVDMTSTLWVILVASVFAAAAAAMLARYGDRGAATGVAAVAGTAVAVVGAVVEGHAFVGGILLLW